MVQNRFADAEYQNELLSQLPPREIHRLAPHFRLEELSKDQILYEPGERIKHIYFPEDALLSLLAGTKQDQFLEVSAAGTNGMVGVQAILQSRRMPFRVLVQISGKAWRLNAKELKAEFERSKPLHDLLLRYLQVLFTQLSQSIVCNRFHRIEERLSRWLLAWRSEIQQDEMLLTHQAMARMLGVPRTLITKTAQALQGAGVIDYQHGHITILDEEGLAEKACECHGIVQRETTALLGIQSSD
jgi:CRP-like cAMP-binding protein